MTREQAKRLAKQIFDEFDEQIVEATSGTAIPPSFIAGLIANEAGKDRSGRIVRGATRFEPHVFRQLYAVRSGQRASYNRISQADIRDASDAALRALSTSYEATQIMGWHVVRNLRCTIADLRNPDKHFFYTVKLLELNGFPSGAGEDRMDREMREWNTGSETGRTYHASYVGNAKLVRAAYRELEAARSSRALADRINVPIEDIDRLPDVSFDEFEDLRDDEINIEIPTFAAGGSSGAEGPAPTEDVPAEPQAGGDTPASNAQPPQQVAENITNVSSGSGPTVPPDFVPENKAVGAPPAEGSTAAATKMTVAGIVVPTFLVSVVTAIKSAFEQGFINAAQVGEVVINFISQNTKFVFAGIGLVIGGMMLKKLYKQITLWLSMYFAARPDMHNVTAKPQ